MWEKTIFGFEVYFLFYNFFLYSFFGWIYESTFVSIRTKRLVNRGFLNGPLVPIYGAGATIVYVCLSRIQDNLFFVFLGGMVIATILEYVTSYIMECLFHAKWWDYSNQRFQIHGRVCLKASLFWGVLSVCMTQLFQPIIEIVIEKIPKREGTLAGYGIFILFVLDLTVTIINTIQLDLTLGSMQRMKEEFSEYLGNLKRNVLKEEWKNRLEQTSFLEWMEQAKQGLNEKKESMYEVSAMEEEEDKSLMEELEERLKAYIEKYQKSTRKKGLVKKRLLRAFPNMKAKNRESVFLDLKEKLLEKRKKEK